MIGKRDVSRIRYEAVGAIVKAYSLYALPIYLYNYYTLWSLPQVPIYVALLEKRP